MDQDASSTVIKGTLIISASSAFLTGIFGIVAKNAHYGLLAGAAAINSGVTAVTFFGIREFAVSPVLVSSLPWPQYARRRRELGIDDNQPGGPELSWSDLRKHKTLDSGISGFAAGGLLRGWKSGPRAMLSGALTAGAICTILQVAYNELGVTRLRYISRVNKENSIPMTPDISPISPPVSQEAVKSFSEKILTTFGLQPISDEEYLAKMKIKREIYLKRIAELEAQLEVDKVKVDPPP